MVLASINGSSASKAYGKAGTVNAMGLSSGVEPSLGFLRPLAASTLARSESVPKRAAPARLPVTRNSRRFMRNSFTRRTNHEAARLYVRAVKSLNCWRNRSCETSSHIGLDARKSPSGRFGDGRVIALGEFFQNADGLLVAHRIWPNNRIPEGDAGVAHQTSPLCALDRAAAEYFSKLRWRKTGDLEQVGQVKRVRRRLAGRRQECARLKFRQAGARRFVVPRANVLADVTSENVAAHRFAKFLGNRAAKFDGQ